MKNWVKIGWLTCALAAASGAFAQDDSPAPTVGQRSEGEHVSLLPDAVSRNPAPDDRGSPIPLSPVMVETKVRAVQPTEEPARDDSAILESARPVTGKPAGPLRRITRRISPEKLRSEPTEASPQVRESQQKPASVQRGRAAPLQQVPAAQEAAHEVLIREGTHNPLDAGITRFLPPSKRPPPLPPSQAHVEFRRSAGRMADALRARDKEAADQEMQFLRSHTMDLRACVSNLPLEKRLRASAISRMYAEGLQLIEDGRRSGEESKIRMGFERLEEAHRYMSQLGCDKAQ